MRLSAGFRARVVGVGLLMLGLTAPRLAVSAPRDTIAPAEAALRTLQFDQALQLLAAPANAANPRAQYLLGLMYLNGVGTPIDLHQAQQRLAFAAAHDHPAAAFVLAGLLAQLPQPPESQIHELLGHAATLGYPQARDALDHQRLPLSQEWSGVADAALLTGWTLDRARHDDGVALRAIGSAAVHVRDPFGRDALDYAAAAGSVDAATALLDLGADVHVADQEGTTALMIAAERPDVAMVALLVQHGAATDAHDQAGRTAVFYAARADRPQMIQALQGAGAPLAARDARGYNALDDASAVGAAAAAEQLRMAGVRPNRTAPDAIGGQGTFDAAHPGDLYRGWPPLALAVARNDAAGVKSALDAGGDANLRVTSGETVLQVATDVHAVDAIHVLLQYGADPALANREGHTPLWLAAVRADEPMLTVLLAAGVAADTHAPSETPATLAARGAMRRMLLAAGARADSVDPRGRTLLMMASLAADAEQVRLLLEHHARPDAADQEHRTALWYAAASGSREIVALLVAAGAPTDAIDRRGLSALHAAAAQPEAAVLAPLLSTEAGLNQRSGAGDTPLLVAAAGGHLEVVRALLAHHPDLNVQDTSGDTALIAASRAGAAPICRLLLQAGADRSLRNGAGASARDVASRRGFADVAQVLAD